MAGIFPRNGSTVYNEAWYLSILGIVPLDHAAHGIVIIRRLPHSRQDNLILAEELAAWTVCNSAVSSIGGLERDI